MQNSRSIQIAANGIVSFFFMDEEYSILYMHHIFFIQSLLGSFHVLAIADRAAVSTGVHVFFQIKSFVWIYAQE